MKLGQIVGIDDVAGKTVRCCLCSWASGEALVVFDDDTFLCLSAFSDRDGNTDIIDVRNFDPLGFGDKLLVEAGLAEQSEMDALQADRDARYREQRAAAERLTYERLRAKFEATP